MGKRPSIGRAEPAEFTGRPGGCVVIGPCGKVLKMKRCAHPSMENADNGNRLPIEPIDDDMRADPVQAMTVGKLRVLLANFRISANTLKRFGQ